jgi:hypothetical protein
VLAIGILGILVPMAVVAAIVVARRTTLVAVSVSGVIAGLGLTLIAIGLTNLVEFWGVGPCTGAPMSLGPGQTSVECGPGAAPAPWLISGAVVVLAAVTSSLMAERGKWQGGGRQRDP